MEMLKILDEVTLDPRHPETYAFSFKGAIDEFNYSTFHFAVWLSGQNKLPACTIVVPTQPGRSMMTDKVPKIVLFSHRADMRAFKQWFARYSKNFIGVNPIEVFMPSLPKTGSYRLHFTEFDNDEDRKQMDNFGLRWSDRIVDAWIWIAHNCAGQAFRTEGGFAFTKVSDAVMFKLAKG